jgi:chromosome segregation ATPase
MKLETENEQIEVLKQKLVDNENTIMNSNQQIHALTQQISVLNEELVNTQQQIQELTTSLTASNLLVDTTKIELVTMETRATTAESELQIELNEITTLRSTLSEKENELKQLLNETMNLESDIEQIETLKQTIVTLKNSENELTQKLIISQKQLEETQHMNTELNNNLINTEQSSNYIQDLQAQLISIKKDFNIVLEEQEQSSNEFTQQLTTVTSQLTVAEQQLTTVTSQLTAAEQQLIQKQLLIDENKIEIDGMYDILRTREQQLETERINTQTITTQYNEMKSQIDSLIKDKELFNSKNQQLLVQISQLTNKHENIIQDMNSKRIQLENEINSKNTLIEQLNINNNQLLTNTNSTIQPDDYDEKLIQLKNELSNIQNLYNKLQNEYTTKIEHYKQTIIDLENDNKKLVEMFESTDDIQIHDLLKKIEDLKSTIKRKEAEMEETDLMMASMDETNEKLLAQIELLTSQREAMKIMVERSEQETGEQLILLQQMNERNDILTEENELLRTQHSLPSASIQPTNASPSKLVKKLQSLLMSYEDLLTDEQVIISDDEHDENDEPMMLPNLISPINRSRSVSETAIPTPVSNKLVRRISKIHDTLLRRDSLPRAKRNSLTLLQLQMEQIAQESAQLVQNQQESLNGHENGNENGNGNTY